MVKLCTIRRFTIKIRANSFHFTLIHTLTPTHTISIHLSECWMLWFTTNEHIICRLVDMNWNGTFWLAWIKPPFYFGPLLHSITICIYLRFLLLFLYRPNVVPLQFNVSVFVCVFVYAYMHANVCVCVSVYIGYTIQFGEEHEFAISKRI